MAAIVIRGPLGVGKTAVGKMLVERLGGCYVSFDSILDDNGLDQVSEEGGIALESFLTGNTLAIAQVRGALDAGVAVVFDGCFYHLEQLEDLIARLPEGALVFTLKASLETCISRDCGRVRSYGADAAAAVHAFVSRFDYGFCIDTEGKTEEQVMDEICATITVNSRGGHDAN